MITELGVALNLSLGMYPIAYTAKDVWEYLKEQPVQATIFIDVDDTLITPCSRMLRSDGDNVIDKLKRDKHLYQNYEEILSSWRLARKIKLTDLDWPNILEQLKERFSVYGLTKIDTGAIGLISSSEEWRYNELKKFGIQFSRYNNFQELSSMSAAEKSLKNSPQFYEGILMTGMARKSETVNKFSSLWRSVNDKSPIIILIDDRIEQLNDLRTFCDERGIAFLGIHFQAVTLLTDRPDHQVMAIQEEKLLNHAQWLEDEEVLLLLAQQQ